MGDTTYANWVIQGYTVMWYIDSLESSNWDNLSACLKRFHEPMKSALIEGHIHGHTQCQKMYSNLISKWLLKECTI